MGGDRDRREIAASHACLFMAEKGVEDFAAHAFSQRRRQPMEALVTRKLISETEGSCGDLRLDAREVRARPAQVCFIRDPGQRGAESPTTDGEVELDSGGSGRHHAAGN